MIPTGQVTIKDIAKKLNISSSTVSRALRNHPDISEKTKKLVKALAEELGYHPDTIAQSLKNKKTTTIGVILPGIDHYFYSSALNGIEDIMYSKGYTIIVSKSNESVEREIINSRALISNRVAGLIVSISQSTTSCEHFTQLQNRGVPVVFFDRYSDDINASKVIVDDEEGAYQATVHLIEKGYKKIAHLSGPDGLSISEKRLAGYKRALSELNVTFDPTLVHHGGLNEKDGAIGVAEMLDSNLSFDALLAINDPVAVGVYAELKKRKLKIPNDIALVGFSDNPISALIEPPLTTVFQPAYEMGKEAALILLNEINENVPHTTKVLATKLVVREST